MWRLCCVILVGEFAFCLIASSQYYDYDTVPAPERRLQRPRLIESVGCRAVQHPVIVNELFTSRHNINNLKSRDVSAATPAANNPIADNLLLFST